MNEGCVAGELSLSPNRAGPSFPFPLVLVLFLFLFLFLFLLLVLIFSFYVCVCFLFRIFLPRPVCVTLFPLLSFPFAALCQKKNVLHTETLIPLLHAHRNVVFSSFRSARLCVCLCVICETFRDAPLNLPSVFCLASCS